MKAGSTSREPRASVELAASRRRARYVWSVWAVGVVIGAIVGASVVAVVWFVVVMP